MKLGNPVPANLVVEVKMTARNARALIDAVDLTINRPTADQDLLESGVLYLMDALHQAETINKETTS